MELALIAGMLAAGIALVIYSVMPKRTEEIKKLERRMAGQRGGDEKARIRKLAKETATKRVMDRVAPMAMKPVMPKSDEELSVLKVKLANAGYRQSNATKTFLASKTVLGVAITVLAVAITLGAGYETNKILSYSIFSGGLAFMFPNLWLSSAISKRSKLIQQGLPDAMDLMVVCVEAGLALDAAIQRVADELSIVHPQLAEEFEIAIVESQMGIPRSEALLNMALRTGVGEVKSMVAIVTQAEKFGTSVGKALRNQADALRIKRRQAAEEKAQQTTVKLLIPLILFIFPALGVVLAGPAALHLMRAFK